MSDEGTTHTVVAGDTLLSIAHDYGFRSWETIWDHPGNATLKRQRQDPTILAPGDQVFVPGMKEKKEAAETGKRNTYWLRSLKARLRYVVRFESGRKAANTLYRLKVGGQEFEGRTDPDGVIDVEISPKARQGELTVWYDESDPDAQFTWEIAVGGMTPVETIAGIQSRLNFLGFDAGPVTNEMNEQTRAALRAFQDFIGAGDPTGEPDENTLKALELLQNSQ